MSIVNEEFKVEAAMYSLRNMLGKGYFCVCDINNCADLLNIIIPKDTQEIFDVLHCVNFNEMGKDFREKLMKLIMETFSDGNKGFKDIEIFCIGDVKYDIKNKSFLKKLSETFGKSN